MPPPNETEIVKLIPQRVAELAPPGVLCVAVSGGADSMVLLDAAVRSLGPGRVAAATFDHGTGTWATAAARLVTEYAGQLGIRWVAGQARSMDSPTEALWRRQRWAFLRKAARVLGQDGTPVHLATAHTLDDQAETVFIRILRGAGPRGMAGLYASSPVIRPLLGFRRSDIEAYAAARNITFVTDPSNADRRHLRNRVRHDLLPVLMRHQPHFQEELVAIGARSAEWRQQMDAIAATFQVVTNVNDSGTESLHVSRRQLEGMSEPALRVLWPALVARADIVMDWRGTHRLAAFTIEGRAGQTIQLSGGITVLMRRDSLIVRRHMPTETASSFLSNFVSNS